MVSSPVRLVEYCALLTLALLSTSTALTHVTHCDNPPSASIHEEATIFTVMPFASVYRKLASFNLGKDRLETVSSELATSWN